MELTKNTTNSDPVQAAPAQPAGQPKTQPEPAAVQPTATPQKPKPSIADMEAAHERAHKRLTIIETVGVVLLVFLLLSAAAVWAFYQQESNAADREPYSTNEYQ